jgi:hypothetical protein
MEVESTEVHSENRTMIKEPTSVLGAVARAKPVLVKCGTDFDWFID